MKLVFELKKKHIFGVMFESTILDWNFKKATTRRPDGADSKHLCNVGKLLPDDTAQQPRKQPSSFSSPWEPQISQPTDYFKYITNLTKMQPPNWLINQERYIKNLKVTSRDFQGFTHSHISAKQDSSF
jgi:hypothetical protein